MATKQRASPTSRSKSVLIVGDTHVGKKKLTRKFQAIAGSKDILSPEVKEEFNLSFMPVDLDGKGLKPTYWIWQRKWKENIIESYKSSQGIFMVYDNANPESFHNLRSYMKDIRSACSTDISIIILGNHKDEAKHQLVSEDQGRRFAEENGFGFCSVSTVNDKNVALALYMMNGDLKYKEENYQEMEKKKMTPQKTKLFKSKKKTDKGLEFLGDMYKKESTVKDTLPLKSKSKKRTEVYPKDVGIPKEILQMDARSIEIFTSALRKGKYKSYHLRIMFVGHFGVGKTSLAMGLLQKIPFDVKITSTNGIDIFNGRCFYNRKTGEWVMEEKARDFDFSAPEIIARDIFESMDIRNSRPDQSRGKDEDILYETLPDKSSQLSQDRTTESSDSDKDENKETKEKREDDDNRLSALMQDLSFKATNDLLEKVINEKKKTRDGMDEFLVPVDIWDFGGQAVFYTTHQTFLTDRSIYLLAFDASRDLEDEVQDQSLDAGGKGKSSVLEYLRFWISSITTYTEGHGKGSPKIILIGTHWDLIPQEKRQERKEKIKIFISEHFSDELSKEQLVIDDELFFNATDPGDSGYVALQAAIIRQAESQTYWGEELPKSWLPLHDTLFDMKRKGRKIVPLEVIKHMNNLNLANISIDELDVFLNFLHSLGHILYFNVADLKDYVILDPQWLIDGLKSLITAELFCENNKEKHLAWQNMSKQGILSKDTIYNLWSLEGKQQFALHRSHLLKTMEKLDLMVKPMTYDESGKVCETDYFYVPCMLKESYPEDRSCFVEHLLQGSVRLQCVFQRKLLPLVVYNRLVAACIGNWPVLDNHLYFGLCLLKLDTFHNLILRRNGHVIEIFVSHRRGKSCVSKRLRRGIEDVISSMLKKIIIVYKANWFISETGSEEDEEGLPFTLQWQSDIQESIEDLQYECPDDCSGLPLSALESTPTDVELSRLSACLGPGQLYPVAIELGLSELEVDAIRHDNRCHRDVVFLVLQLWRNKTSKKKASIKTLISAFTEMGDVDRHTFCKIYRIYDEAAIDTEDLPENKRRIIPSDEILHATAVYINDKFLHVAMEISIPCNEMKLIQMKHSFNPLAMIREMLQYWKEKSSTPPTVENLAIAMRVVGCDFRGLCDQVKSHPL